VNLYRTLIKTHNGFKCDNEGFERFKNKTIFNNKIRNLLDLEDINLKCRGLNTTKAKHLIPWLITGTWPGSK